MDAQARASPPARPTQAQLIAWGLPCALTRSEMKEIKAVSGSQPGSLSRLASRHFDACEDCLNYWRVTQMERQFAA